MLEAIWCTITHGKGSQKIRKNLHFTEEISLPMPALERLNETQAKYVVRTCVSTETKLPSNISWTL